MHATMWMFLKSTILSKKPNMKDYKLNDSIYIKFQKGQNYNISRQKADQWCPEVRGEGKGINYRDAQGTFGDGGNVVYDYESGEMAMYDIQLN